MGWLSLALCASSYVASLVSAAPSKGSLPYESRGAYDSLKMKRQYGGYNNSPLLVDLGYEVYNGYYNNSLGLNFWQGIRYAAPPTGQNRWQPPQTPALNRSNVIQANHFASRCPQASDGPNTGPICANLMNATSLPASCLNDNYFTRSIEGNEDCLFLNVYAPPNAKNLPVMVWIHGGGYGAGDGTQNLTRIMSANDNGFVSVAIQYRLGAFGFLSSDEVYRFGAVNGGILDQHFALQWVQSYISLFGGDPTRVTITGESAGGGSVMLQVMAYGGTEGTSLFQNSIAASPYLPFQFGFKDFWPSQGFYAFAYEVGCFNGLPFQNRSRNGIMDCLRSKDTLVLQQANYIISGSAPYGQWAFVPVTDGKIVQQLPSQQLLYKQVNGLRHMAGNNAEEGPGFTPQDISTEEKLVAFINATFPLFSEDDISKLLLYYPSTNASDNPNAPLFSTLGYTGPTAVNQSDEATGQQQRANDIYAETTFVCPSYWLAEAFAQPGHAGYKYQFSVPPAFHGSDVSWYFGPTPAGQSEDSALAFRRIWGNFIIHNDPSISASYANGLSTGNTSASPASAWPAFSAATPYQLNINVTGGTPSTTTFGFNGGGGSKSVPVNVEPGLRNDITLVNAYTWEGGRGYRCDFWRSIGGIVPE